MKTGLVKTTNANITVPVQHTSACIMQKQIPYPILAPSASFGVLVSQSVRWAPILLEIDKVLSNKLRNY